MLTTKTNNSVFHLLDCQSEPLPVIQIATRNYLAPHGLNIKKTIANILVLIKKTFVSSSRLVFPKKGRYRPLGGTTAFKRSDGHYRLIWGGGAFG